MPGRAVDDKPSDTLVVVSGEGSWTGSSTLPHLHHLDWPRVRDGSPPTFDLVVRRLKRAVLASMSFDLVAWRLNRTMWSAIRAVSGSQASIRVAG